MMRNVAIGAVLGFGLMVLLLSLFSNPPPPQAPAPAPAPAAPPPTPASVVVAPLPTAADGGVAEPVPLLMPLNTSPVIVTPTMPSAPKERAGVMKSFARERAAAMWQNRQEIITGDAGPQ